MSLFRRLSPAVGAVLLVCSSNAFAAGDLASVNIVDAPRPQPKWGYAPAKQKIEAGTWVTWSNNGQDAHTVTAVDGTLHIHSPAGGPTTLTVELPCGS